MEALAEAKRTKKIKIEKVRALLPVVLWNNQLDMAAAVAVIFSEFAEEVLSAIAKAAKPDGSLGERIADIQEIVKERLPETFDRFRKEFYTKLEFAARLPYEAEVVTLAYYFGGELGEAAGSFAGTFGIEPTPVFAGFINRQAKANIEAATTRIYADKLNLSSRIWKLENGGYEKIQRILSDGIARKSSAIELSQKLVPYIQPDSEWTRWSRSRLYKMVPAERAADFKGLMRKPRLIPAGGIPPTNGLAYNALRMARHEINQIGVDASLESMRASPWVDGIRWLLSTNHAEQDVCDDLASGGPEGHGVYPVRDFPQMPAHIQCYCFPEDVRIPPENFVDRLRDWTYGRGDWPAFDDYATRLDGDLVYGAFKRMAMDAIGRAEKVAAARLFEPPAEAPAPVIKEKPIDWTKTPRESLKRVIKDLEDQTGKTSDWSGVLQVRRIQGHAAGVHRWNGNIGIDPEYRDRLKDLLSMIRSGVKELGPDEYYRLQSLQVITHEANHAINPIAAGLYRTPEGRAYEEALTEFMARRQTLAMLEAEGVKLDGLLVDRFNRIGAYQEGVKSLREIERIFDQIPFSGGGLDVIKALKYDVAPANRAIYLREQIYDTLVARGVTPERAYDFGISVLQDFEDWNATGLKALANGVKNLLLYQGV